MTKRILKLIQSWEKDNNGPITEVNVITAKARRECAAELRSLIGKRR